MLTETISGKCPCCGYNKLIQRYGSVGYYLLDGCAKCGFGYGSNGYKESDDIQIGTESWIEYGLHIVASNLANEEVPYPEILVERMKKSGKIECNIDEDYIKWSNKYDIAYSKYITDLNIIDIINKRRAVFDAIDKCDRFDDVENTVFNYSNIDIKNYMDTNPIIFQ